MAEDPHRIKCLPTDIQIRIKSSVQIHSLNDVVLELVKNSLDAKATKLEVRLDLIKGFCMVLDDGYGIPATEFLASGGLAKQYHTSKTKETDTYGRNGCFLATLSGVSVLSISSAESGSGVLQSAMWKSGECIARSQTREVHIGTKAVVYDLFGNVPVRKRFQRHRYEHRQELEKDYQTLKSNIVGLLLASDRSFSIIMTEENLKQSLQYRVPFKVETRLQHPVPHTIEPILQRTSSVISQTYPTLQIGRTRWRTATIETPSLSISGVFNLQALPTKSMQFISIGQHPVHHSFETLYDQVNAAFQQSDFVSKSQFQSVSKWPAFCIQINPCPSVSADPEKLVKPASDALRDLILEFLRAHDFCLNSELSVGKQSPVGTEDRYQACSFDAWSRIKSAKRMDSNEFVSGLPFTKSSIGRAHDGGSNEPSMQVRLNAQPGRNDQPRSARSVTEAAKSIRQRWDGSGSCEEDDIQALDVRSAKVDADISRQSLQMARVVGQLDEKFILATVDDLLIVIDQHAADERVKVEEYYSRICTGTRTTLPTPIHYELDSSEIGLCQRAQRYLSSWGVEFTIKHEANASISVTALPEIIAERCRTQPQLLMNMLRVEIWKMHEIGKGTSQKCCDPSNDWVTNIVHCPQGILDMLVSRACRSAIMFNDVLSKQQAGRLVQQLADCVFPFQCAHGRPSITSLARLP